MNQLQFLKLGFGNNSVVCIHNGRLIVQNSFFNCSIPTEFDEQDVYFKGRRAGLILEKMLNDKYHVSFADNAIRVWNNKFSYEIEKQPNAYIMHPEGAAVEASSFPEHLSFHNIDDVLCIKEGNAYSLSIDNAFAVCQPSPRFPDGYYLSETLRIAAKTGMTPVSVQKTDKSFTINFENDFCITSLVYNEQAFKGILHNLFSKARELEYTPVSKEELSNLIEFDKNNSDKLSRVVFDKGILSSVSDNSRYKTELEFPASVNLKRFIESVSITGCFGFHDGIYYFRKDYIILVLASCR